MGMGGACVGHASIHVTCHRPLRPRSRRHAGGAEATEAAWTRRAATVSAGGTRGGTGAEDQHRGSGGRGRGSAGRGGPGAAGRPRSGRGGRRRAAGRWCGLRSAIRRPCPGGAFGAAPRPVRAELGHGRRAGSDAALPNLPGQLRNRALPFGSGFGIFPGLGSARSQRREALLTALFRRLDEGAVQRSCRWRSPPSCVCVSAGSKSRRPSSWRHSCVPTRTGPLPSRQPRPGAERRTRAGCARGAVRNRTVGAPPLSQRCVLGWARPWGNPAAPRDYRWRCPGGLRDFSKRG